MVILKLKQHLEELLGLEGLDKEFEPIVPEPFPGFNRNMDQYLKENFIIRGINSMTSMSYLDRIVVDFYENNGYNFLGFVEPQIRGVESYSKYAFKNEENDYIGVQLTRISNIIGGSVVQYKLPRFGAPITNN